MTAAGGPEHPGDGWAAELGLRFVRRGRRTVLADTRRRGPLGVQRPFYPEDQACHCYLLHPPGGVVGGDRLDLRLTADDRAHALITTPGATKFYRSRGPEARVVQRLSVAPGATLEWLPQGGILFPGALLRASTRVELAGDARFIGWEIQTLGRPAIAERYCGGRADLGFELHRDGRPVLMERLRIEGEAGLEAPSGLRGHPIYGTLLATPATGAVLDAVRRRLAEHNKALAAATLMDGLLILRCLGRALEPVMQTLVGAWEAIRPLLLGCSACPPRIWAT